MKLSIYKSFKITKWKVFALVILLLGIGILITNSLSVPQYLTVKGTLRNSTGSLLSGNYNITFRIYNDSSSGALKWSETQEVNVSTGVYYAILGSENHLNVSFDEDYWLSLEINSDGEMSPRQRLTSSPYALRSNRTEGLVCVNCINSTQIASVGWDKVINEPTLLSNFTDDLGNRGYTHLGNFTDDILWTSEFNNTGDTRWLTAYSETDPKWTANQSNYYTSSQILGFSYYNTTDFNISNYYLNSNPFGYYNSTNPQTIGDDSHLHTKATVTIDAANITSGEIEDSRVSNNITINSTNNISSTAGITLPDNVKIYFGDSGDIKMYFNGTHFVIEG